MLELMSIAIQEFHDDDECAGDDVKGGTLDPKIVKAARQEEMTYVRKCDITNVPSAAQFLQHVTRLSRFGGYTPTKETTSTRTCGQYWSPKN